MTKTNSTKSKISETEDIKQRSLDAIMHFDIKEAALVVKDLDYELKKLSENLNSNPEEVNYLSYLLVRLKILMLPMLADEEVIRLFKTRFVWMIIDEELDLKERIETRQLTSPASVRFESVNGPIIEALHENEERIGQNKIFVQGNNEAVVSTIKNWLLDYDRTYGTGPLKDLVPLDYAANNRNAAPLSAEEKSVLRKVLKFYEFLKVVRKLEE